MLIERGRQRAAELMQMPNSDHLDSLAATKIIFFPGLRAHARRAPGRELERAALSTTTNHQAANDWLGLVMMPNVRDRTAKVHRSGVAGRVHS